MSAAYLAYSASNLLLHFFGLTALPGLKKSTYLGLSLIVYIGMKAGECCIFYLGQSISWVIICRIKFDFSSSLGDSVRPADMPVVQYRSKFDDMFQDHTDIFYNLKRT